MPSPYIRPRSTKHKAAMLPQAAYPIPITADGAVPVTEDATYNLAKGSAVALTIAAPGAANVGRRIRFITSTDFGHVVTFTGSTLRDGTTGASITWTATAFRGCALEIIALDATTWYVMSMNLGAIV